MQLGSTIAGLGITIALPVLLHGSLAAAQTDRPILEVLSVGDSPVLEQGDPGTEGVKYGFEGGRVLKHAGAYHLFTSECVGDPKWVKMRLAHWKSRDGRSWQRVSTLFESSGDYTGADPRAALWSPMPIYDHTSKRWMLTYVAYRAKPDSPTAWYRNYDGRIWLAESTVEGPDGLGGPYADKRVLHAPGPESGEWEGLQGVDSFFIYPALHRWWAFHGSAKTEQWPCRYCGVGLASAPVIAGPWKREAALSPVNLGVAFAENPVVTRLHGGHYVAMVDGGGERNAFGYTTSLDGIHWSTATFVDLAKHTRKWWRVMRTPLGLIDEGNNEYTLYFTALTSAFDLRHQDMMSDPHAFGAVGWARLRVVPVRVPAISAGDQL